MVAVLVASSIDFTASFWIPVAGAAGCDANGANGSAFAQYVVYGIDGARKEATLVSIGE